MQLVIDPTGGIRCMYGEALPLDESGHLVQRH